MPRGIAYGTDLSDFTSSVGDCDSGGGGGPSPATSTAPTKDPLCVSTCSHAHPHGFPSLGFRCPRPNPPVLSNLQRVGTRREYLSSPHQDSLIVVCRNPLSDTNLGSSISLQSPSSRPHTHVVPLSSRLSLALCGNSCRGVQPPR